MHKTVIMIPTDVGFCVVSTVSFCRSSVSFISRESTEAVTPWSLLFTTRLEESWSYGITNSSFVRTFDNKILNREREIHIKKTTDHSKSVRRIYN